ncbi:MAG: sulfatase-like hydrolase/transferase [Lentisphaeraceae bacterium]|nr:sulfatase-like hydrolase/transferase [Lentisphaeraceae bacterium]
MCTKFISLLVLLSLTSIVAFAGPLDSSLQVREGSGQRLINSLYGVDKSISGSSIWNGSYSAEDGTATMVQGNSAYVFSGSVSFVGERAERDFIIQSDKILSAVRFKNESGVNAQVLGWSGQGFEQVGSEVLTNGSYHYKVSMTGNAGSRFRINSKEGAAKLQFFVTRPNILFVIIDDYGVDVAPAPYKNLLDTKTPQLDSMIKGGTSFMNCWVYSKCSPTRASIMTGRYGFRNGVGTVISTGQELSSSETTLPQVLKSSPAEYEASLIGKWHLGKNSIDYPGIMGWEHFNGLLEGGVFNYFSWSKYENGVGPLQIGSRETQNPEDYITSVFVDDAISWIEQKKDKPWLTWLAMNAPHTPLHIPPANLHTYDEDGADLNDPTVQFKAIVEALDTELGRLFDYLKGNEELKNTIVVILGDNGTDSGAIDFGQQQKGTLYEGGVKVPFVVWSGKHVPNFLSGNGQQSRVVQNVVNGLDMFSTFLELAGVSEEEVNDLGVKIDSKSILPYFINETESNGLLPSVRDFIYSEAFANEAADINPDKDGQTIRNQLYKLLQFDNGQEYFFKASSIDTDIDEAVNLLDGQLNSEDLENYELLKSQLESLQQN